ncbi:helix-turn-helix transcriptional regulator [Streptomyces sp. NPDC048637]|uniref:helix-turn-helix domain-containing protein n=1 Tax=Streptomyces sp. NPDC048637 TaxID=3155636 RepID=UPI003425301C
MTNAELQVAALLAEGCTNPEIAARTVWSRSTIQTHVSNILRNLCLTSQAELAREFTHRSQESLPMSIGQVGDVGSMHFGAE